MMSDTLSMGSLLDERSADINGELGSTSITKTQSSPVYSFGSKFIKTMINLPGTSANKIGPKFNSSSTYLFPKMDQQDYSCTANPGLSNKQTAPDPRQSQNLHPQTTTQKMALDNHSPLAIQVNNKHITSIKHFGVYTQVKSISTNAGTGLPNSLNSGVLEGDMKLDDLISTNIQGSIQMTLGEYRKLERDSLSKISKNSTPKSILLGRDAMKGPRNKSCTSVQKSESSSKMVSFAANVVMFMYQE